MPLLLRDIILESAANRSKQTCISTTEMGEEYKYRTMCGCYLCVCKHYKNNIVISGWAN